MNRQRIKSKKDKPAWREWVESLGGAIILTFFIITFIGQSYVVDGSSMETTLSHGQRMIVEKVTYRFNEPSHGEIIVLRVPGSQFIKRIIAVEGDTIAERNGVIYINGNALDEPYVTNKTSMNWGPFRVPEGKYWVMGDNRPNSDDSRGTVGFLSRDDVVGRAVFRYWPLGRLGVL